MVPDAHNPTTPLAAILAEVNKTGGLYNWIRRYYPDVSETSPISHRPAQLIRPDLLGIGERTERGSLP